MQFRLSRLGLNAVAQACEHRDSAGTPVFPDVSGIELHGNPEARRRLRILKPGRHHADDFVSCLVEHQRLSDRLRPRTVPLCPEGVTQNRHAQLSAPVFTLRKGAPKQRNGAQYVEEIRRHLTTLHALGPLPARRIEGAHVQMGRIAGQAAVGAKDVERSAHSNVGEEQTLRGGEGQRPDQDGVHQAEHRGGGADAEGHGRQRHGGETPILREQAGAVGDVLLQLLPSHGATRVAALLLDRIHPAHARSGPPASFRGRHAQANQLLGFAFEMLGQFRLHLALDLRPPQRGPQSQ